MALVVIGAGGAHKVHEELWGKWVGGVRHTIRDLWPVSIDVVFEHTIPVAVGEDQL